MDVIYDFLFHVFEDFCHGLITSIRDISEFNSTSYALQILPFLFTYYHSKASSVWSILERVLQGAQRILYLNFCAHLYQWLKFVDTDIFPIGAWSFLLAASEIPTHTQLGILTTCLDRPIQNLIRKLQKTTLYTVLMLSNLEGYDHYPTTDSHVSPLIYRTMSIMQLQSLVSAGNLSRLKISRLGEKPSLFRPITIIKVAEHSFGSGLVEDETLAQKKKELYKAVEGINRGIFGIPSAKKSEIESLVKQLESQNPTPEPTQELEKVDGCWRLVYSTISVLGSKRTKLGLRDFISLGDFLQIIDKAKSKAVNVIKFNARGLSLLSGQLSIEASFKISSTTRVDINFENSTITPDQLMNLFRKNYDLLLGIFNPEGWLDITYVDETLRIGRDDKGNIFVLERFEDASKL